VPTYSYKCGTCAWRGTRLKPMAERDEPMDCPRCGATVSRMVDSPLDLIGRARPGPNDLVRARAVKSSKPALTIRNFTATNARTGVHMVGGHVDVDGFVATDVPVAFQLEGGATADVRNAVQRTSRTQRRADRRADRASKDKGH
jgi:putative FmdB family regulatory protein